MNLLHVAAITCSLNWGVALFPEHVVKPAVPKPGIYILYRCKGAAHKYPRTQRLEKNGRVLIIHDGHCMNA